MATNVGLELSNIDEEPLNSHSASSITCWRAKPPEVNHKRSRRPTCKICTVAIARAAECADLGDTSYSCATFLNGAIAWVAASQSVL